LHEPLIEQSPLRHADLYHTGIVVDDLTTAKEEFGALLGVTWLEGGGEVRLVTETGPMPVAASYALSAEGPHHVELVQAVPGTLYTVGVARQAHHLGYWTDDVEAASAALARAGLPRECTMDVGEGSAPMCAYHRAGDGFYVELVSAAMKRVFFRTPRQP
jgi:hypothetical protein